MEQQQQPLTFHELARANEMKRDLQRLTAGIRNRNFGSVYPKAVMTDKMKEKGTALINCGEDANKALKLSEGILSSIDLKAYMQLYSVYHVTAERDTRKNLYNQPVPCIRLRYDVRDRK